MAATTSTSAGASESDTLQAPLSEPSMEDILASIRRIIAEDQSNTLGRTGVTGLTRRTQIQPAPAVLAEETDALPVALNPAHEAPVASQAEPLHATAESLEAYQPFAVETGHPDLPSSEDNHFIETSSATSDGFDRHAAYADAESPELDDHGQLPSAREDIEPLVSASTGASISSSFQTLAESVMLQDPELIERVLRESMRPLLKAWLDDHLPSIVERLVRAEIERVARGGRARSY